MQDEAQICLNGHCVNAYVTSEANRNRPYCSKCGAATIAECPACRHTILGGDELLLMGDKNPKYCAHCGKPMPWTEDAFSKTEELLDAIDELTAEERSELKACLPDLVSDTSRSPIAALKTGKAMRKVEAHFRDAFKQTLFSLIAAKTQAILKPYGF